LRMDPTLHHVGYVVPSIPDVVEAFARSVHTTWDGQIHHDPLQGVHVTFLVNKGNQSQPMIELVAPAGEQSPVTNFLQKGGGLHHLCFETDDLEQQLRQAKEDGAIIVRKPLPAVAFKNRRIGWVYTPARLLIEYLERQQL
jgi:methylmalonyl-CoA/ethylmalonyl-CoA epimerase